ncbi:hypothetical protein AB4Y96_09035 [Phyllobacterium sp. TAF24]|uniref:hypothetical protein n=1 Tax=Phyllobacterium sp. TAF24 TaxID=3233068 RepID=UPI003F945031
MQPAPISLQYEGEGVFQPSSPFHARMADKHYVIGQHYRMGEHHDRSKISHNHEFAFIGEAWQNLPELFKDEPWAQSPEHLRKYALIRCRYCDTQAFPCGTRAEALRWAANLRPMDEYSLVTVDGTIVYRFIAKSQSMRAMGKQLFQESKQAIMDFIDDLLGVERGDTVRSEAA